MSAPAVGTLPRLADRYLEHLAGERALAAHTLRAYRGDLERFLLFAGRDWLACDPSTVMPDQLDAGAVRGFLGALTREGVGRRSQGRALAAVRGLFRFAVRGGALAASPAAPVRTPKAPQKLPRHLRPAEIEAVLDAAAAASSTTSISAGRRWRGSFCGAFGVRTTPAGDAGSSPSRTAQRKSPRTAASIRPWLRLPRPSRPRAPRKARTAAASTWSASTVVGSQASQSRPTKSRKRSRSPR